MRVDPYHAYVRRFPKPLQKELDQKLEYKRLLESDTSLVLPDNIWFAFLTPRDTRAHRVLKKSESPIMILKKKVLAVFKHPEKFSDSFDPKKSRAVTATLIEILFDLEGRKVLLPKDSYKLWVAIAERYGLWQIRYHMEDAIFKNFDCENYKLFRSVVQKKMQTDARLISDIHGILGQALLTAGIKNFEIRNRQKNVYGVYRKIHIKKKSINDIYDIHGFRILTKTKRDCYLAHEALDRLWPTYKDRYKDYIKRPKENGYRSIHTVLRCLKNIPIEFQIRSFDMDLVAESGLANHADYKK